MGHYRWTKLTFITKQLKHNCVIYTFIVTSFGAFDFAIDRVHALPLGNLFSMAAMSWRASENSPSSILSSTYQWMNARFAYIRSNLRSSGTHPVDEYDRPHRRQRGSSREKVIFRDNYSVSSIIYADRAGFIKII